MWRQDFKGNSSFFQSCASVMLSGQNVLPSPFQNNYIPLQTFLSPSFWKGSYPERHRSFVKLPWVHNVTQAHSNNFTTGQLGHKVNLSTNQLNACVTNNLATSHMASLSPVAVVLCSKSTRPKNHTSTRL